VEAEAEAEEAEEEAPEAEPDPAGEPDQLEPARGRSDLAGARAASAGVAPVPADPNPRQAERPRQLGR
jgi:hypothetical protein